MEFSVQTANPAKAETACLVLPVYKGSDLLPSVAKLDDASERLIGQLLERGDFDAALGAIKARTIILNAETDRYEYRTELAEDQRLSPYIPLWSLAWGANMNIQYCTAAGFLGYISTNRIHHYIDTLSVCKTFNSFF